MARYERRRKRRVLRFVLEVILLLVLAVALLVGSKIAKINKGNIQVSNLVKNDSIDAAERDQMDGFTDIALFGVDSREGDLESGTNSDTIMICSINKKTGEIKLVSVYRDTYLDMTDGRYSKCNSAYATGGAQQAISMLNKNLDLNISDYVTVNFQAVVDIIDMVGGVDITLTEGEVEYLNGYLVEGRQMLGRDCEDVPGPGLQHLNGMQALAYSRIRYIGLDFERTERQRTVLEQVFGKVKSSDLLEMNKMIDTILPEVSTSLSMTELLGLAAKAGSYSMGENQGFPFDLTMMDISAGDCVVPVNLAANVSQLHSFLYGTENYQPSAVVQEISDNIANETGAY
ncbi:MAG: LCP family protein [Eubacteriales bacterium]|nr:LCP family protein [Eubacteriales bacterium]